MIFEDIANRLRSRFGAGTWPPANLKPEWDTAADHRRYFENDFARMLQHDAEFNRSQQKARVFTPVPLARDMATLSAQLLFAEPMSAASDQQDALEEVLETNSAESFFHEVAQWVAIEGSGALRLIRDDSVSDHPLITHVHRDKVIWDIRHGRFVQGGAVIIERAVETNRLLAHGAGAYDYYRLIEYHEPGRVRRELYRGTEDRLGSKLPLSEYPEFDGLAEEEQTNLPVPTLVRWQNRPGGYSDLAGIEPILERLNEAESWFTDKGRKSVPVTLADATLADEYGRVEMAGVQLVRRGPANLNPELGSAPSKMAETIQPGLQSEDHLRWIDHLIDTALERAGYSRASWGRDHGGSADSGKALRFRQDRTLKTRAGKERLARDAIAQALGLALAMKSGGDPKALRPDITFADGLPNDPLETAQEIQLLAASGSASLSERIRTRHPEWDDDAIERESREITGQTTEPSTNGFDQ